MDEYEYESLGANSTMIQNAIAGALAGIGEHCLMYPIDSIKTRMQVLGKGDPTGTSRVARSSRWEWLRSHRHLWRGVYSVVIGAGPAHALHFTTYEYCKQRFGVTLAGWQMQDNVSQLLMTGAAGACATFSHDALLTPFDVIKQRMQLRDSAFRSVRECARTVYRNEGLLAFYISFPTTLYMSIPFQSVQFATYEFCLSRFNSEGGYNPKAHVAAGACAGMIASSVTTPLDVIKTLLQTRGTSNDPVIRNASGFWSAAKIIGERHGYRGFFRGFRPRILTHIPSTAISWSVYEYFKWGGFGKDNWNRHEWNVLATCHKVPCGLRVHLVLCAFVLSGDISWGSIAYLCMTSSMVFAALSIACRLPGEPAHWRKYGVAFLPASYYERSDLYGRTFWLL